MLKIAHVVRRFVFEEWGGTETVVWNTALNQRAQGLQPEILATSALAVRGDEVRDGISIRRFPYFYPYFPMPGRDTLALDKKGGNPYSLPLFRALKQGNYDIIHIHCGGRLAAICEHIAKRRGIPSIITLHGGAADVPPAELRELLRPVRGKFHYGGIIDRLAGLRTDPVRGADAVLCVGRTEEAKLRKAYPGQRIFYLPNGIEAAKFREPDTADVRKEFHIPEERKLILCISRIDYQKNQKILLNLLQKTEDTHLLLIGPVTAQWYCDELTAEVKRLGLTGRFTLVPGLPPGSPLLRSALHSAYVFILPSLHEPFGIAALEAWAAGAPLIASNAGGLKDFIRDGVNGLLFSPGKPEELFRAWEKMQDPVFRRKLAGNGSESVKHFEWSALTRRLTAIYQELKHG